MICFVTSGAHKYAVRELIDVPGMPDIELISYNRLLRARQLPTATYIFADFDRLDFWQLELAAKAFRNLRAGGANVLNDPATCLTRMAMLKRLKAQGLNSFQVWDAVSDGLPDTFPVFLRTRAAHRGTLTGLLNTAEEAAAALKDLTDQGYCLSDLMFVEYCAEPVAENLFRKLAAYCVGGKVVTSMSVHDATWHAKFGQEGVATEELYKDELSAVEENRHGAAMETYFRAANVEFGRADFAMVNGRIEVYEINTNPNNSRILEHPFPIRVEADALFHQRLAEAMQQIDTPKGAPIALDHPDLVRQRKRDWLVLRARWVP